MRWFASKVDWWVAVIVASVPLITVATAVAATFGDDTVAAVTAWGTALAVAVFYASLMWPIRYGVGEGQLVVRFGLVRQRLPLDQVTHIKPSRNPLASPALSLDRLQVSRRGGGSLLLSPADRAGFVRAIVEASPRVTVDPRLDPAG